MNKDCKSIRNNILQASFNSGHGHIPTCFSIIEILYAIYSEGRFKYEKDEDIFILSKGHGSLGYYGVLSHFGYMKSDELNSFGQYRSRLGCHADRKKVPGVYASTGSLGHGIGLAVGVALASKIIGSNRKVYVLIGDGEANEGSCWEALMVAAHNKLSNLVVVFDDNKSQGRCLPVVFPVEKFKSFGFDTVSVDGHNVDLLKQALSRSSNEKPLAIVADTVKGWGCKTLVDNRYEWHRRSPNDEELGLLLRELDA
ncbi:transketolase [Pseudomonadota bacterium]|nr:transketolase [Pseudomonadota bacterium]